jgi:hypothetical protein
MPSDTDGSWRSPAPVPFRPGDMLRDKRGLNPVPDSRGLFVIHAVHLHTGKVLWFCGHAEYLDYPLVAYQFDPRNPSAPAVRKPFPNGADLFCCFCVQLADGKIMIVGGSQLDHVPSGTFNPQTDYRGSSGASTIVIFDPRKEDWEKPDPTRKLLQGRWYPTAVLLGDGSVVVISGRRELAIFAGPDKWPDARLVDWVRNRGIADIVEHLKPPKYRPQALTGANRPIPIYPGIHLAPDDRLYTTHTPWGQEIDEPPTLSLTIVPPPAAAPAGTAATFTWTEYVLPTARARQPEREEGMSVMLPVVLDRVTRVRDPNSVGKFLVVGGGFAVDGSDVSPVRRAIATPAPPWTVTTPPGPGTMAYRRQKIATPQPVEILDTNLPGAPARPHPSAHQRPLRAAARRHRADSRRPRRVQVERHEQQLAGHGQGRAPYHPDIAGGDLHTRGRVPRRRVDDPPADVPLDCDAACRRLGDRRRWRRPERARTVAGIPTVLQWTDLPRYVTSVVRRRCGRHRTEPGHRSVGLPIRLHRDAGRHQGDHRPRAE